MHAVGTSEKVQDAEDLLEDSMYSFDDIQHSPLSSPTRRSDRMSIKAQQDSLLFTPRPLSPVIVQADAAGGTSSNSAASASNNNKPSAARLSLERMVEMPTAEDDEMMIGGTRKDSGTRSGGSSSTAEKLQQCIPLKRPISAHRLALHNDQVGSAASSAPNETSGPATSSTNTALAFKDHLQLLTEGFKRSPIFSFISVEINNCTARASLLETPFVENMPYNPAYSSVAASVGRSGGGVGSSVGGLTTDIRLRRVFSFTNDDAGFLLPQRATWWSQFTILSGRSFKNLYRNPSLLRMHYFISLVSAVICGLLFWKVSNDIQGFQNRLGVFFFICALFGFGCLSSMQVCDGEGGLSCMYSLFCFINTFTPPIPRYSTQNGCCL
jgi:hypothetical protein